MHNLFIIYFKVFTYETDTNYGIPYIFIILSTDNLPISFEAQNSRDFYFLFYQLQIHMINIFTWQWQIYVSSNASPARTRILHIKSVLDKTMLYPMIQSLLMCHWLPWRNHGDGQQSMSYCYVMYTGCYDFEKWMVIIESFISHCPCLAGLWYQLKKRQFSCYHYHRRYHFHQCSKWSSITPWYSV